MDQYSIEFTGKNLDVEKLISALPQHKVRRVHKKGEVTFWEFGVKKTRRVDERFHSSAVIFDAADNSLLDFLNKVLVSLVDFDRSKIEETTVWCVMERQGQINGELSLEEIEGLNKIEAQYCWSVI